MTPAQKHKALCDEHKRKRQAALNSPVATHADQRNIIDTRKIAEDKANPDSAMRIQFEKDLFDLSQNPSRTDRTRIKAEILLPKYRDYLTDVLEGKQEGEPTIMVNAMIWQFDTGNIEDAMKLAQYCVFHELAMPEGYKVDVKGFICRATYEWAERQHEAGEKAEPWLQQVYEMSEDWVIADPIRGNMLKQMGLDIVDEQPEQALELFKKALQADPKATVKNLIKKLKKAEG